MSRVYSKVVQLFICVLKCGCIDISCAVLYLVTQSCPALCDPMTVACRAPLSMGILQARILEGVATPSSRGSSRSRERTQVSRTAGGFFTV